ncbi:MAG: putative Ig domain-containing protein [Thermodesulfovibrionales bacterium]
MKRHILLVALLSVISFIFLTVDVTHAITLSASPNPAAIGQNVTATVTASYSPAAAPCGVQIRFAATETFTNLGSCTTPCNITHVYSSPGLYTVTAQAIPPPLTGGCVSASPPSSVSTNVTVNCPALSITSPSTLSTGNMGEGYSYQLQTSGGQAPIIFSLTSGSLPPGLILSSTGLISGTPMGMGTYNFTATVTDSCAAGAQSLQGDFSITVNAAPCPALSIISPSTLTSGTVGQGYTYQIATSGGQAPITFSIISGELPSGLILSSSGSITGTPLTAGTWNFTVRATDSCVLALRISKKSVSDKSFSITINPAACPSFAYTSPATLSNGTVGQAYSYQLQTSGGQTPIIFSFVSGSLPPGLNLGSTGLISGIPTSSEAYSFTVSATDSCAAGAQSLQGNFSITVNAAPCPALSIISPSTLTSGTVGQGYTYQIATSGGQAPITFSLVSGALPSGLSMSASGLISGTPSPAGTSTFTVRATDSCAGGAQTSDKSMTITVNPAPCAALSITSPSTLPSGNVGQSYAYQITTSGGQSPVIFRLLSDTHPPGLRMTSTGLISGTPTSAGNYTFRVRVTDSCAAGAQSAENDFSITVQLIPPPVTISVNPVPSSFSIPRGYSSSNNVLYQFNGSASINTTLNSAEGNFMAGGEIIGTSSIPLTVQIHNGTGRVAEVINIPVAVIERALRRGSNTFIYVRNFSDASINVIATVNFMITTEAGADFEIKRIDLYFENKRPEITVNRGFPKIRAFADIRFVGSGFLQGYWEVDGRMLSHVDQHLTYGASVTLQTPDIPPMPAFDTGSHVVRFVITNPVTDLSLPSIIYFVTAEEGRGKPVNIVLLSPVNDSLIEYAPVKFEWEKLDKTPLYFIRFSDKPESAPVFSAYAKEAYYTLPDIALKGVFSPGQKYYWKVSGFDAENMVIGESETWGFTFRPYDSYVKGQIIAVFYESAYSEDLLNELKSKYSLTVGDVFPLKSVNLRVIIFETRENDIASIINELMKDSRIMIAQPNYILKTMSDPLRKMQYACDILKTDKIHALYKGNGIKVAVIDTGVDAGHNDLKGRVTITENLVRGDKYTPEIHGTAVAGIIAADSDGYGIEGVAPGADIIALRACRQMSKDQPEGECYTDSLAKALDKAIDQKAHIVNMSFGNIHYDGLLAKLIERGAEQGILFVAPAGNFKNELELRFPASHHAVISVGGFDEKLNPYPNPYITKKTSVCAPAVNILTTVPNNKHNFMTGTSISSAYISGILAIALEKDKSVSKKTLPPYQGDICKWEEELLKIKICEK